MRNANMTPSWELYILYNLTLSQRHLIFAIEGLGLTCIVCWWMKIRKLYNTGRWEGEGERYGWKVRM